MRPRTRHQRTTIPLTPLTGGINAADTPDRLAEGEMTDCTNYLYHQTNLTLTPRGGLLPLYTFPTAIRALHHDTDTNTLFIFLTDRTVHTITDNTAPTCIGTLTGGRLPSCTKFQNNLYIASGDRLQSYNYSDPLTTIPDAPIADLILLRGGRLCAAQTGSDRLRYSAIGDGTAWTNDPNDQSSGGWIDIGYGDSGDITAIVPLATDLIILKTNGRIYQLSGDSNPTAWRVTPLASDTDPVGTRCAAHLKGNVIYLCARGLVSLAATQDYGNITAGDIADKIRPLLQNPSPTARFFPLPRQNLLIIRPHTDKHTLIALHSTHLLATRLTFALPIDDICQTPTQTLIASDRTLHQWTPKTLTDDGTPIPYRIALRHLHGPSRLHLAAIDTRLTSDIPHTVRLTLQHPNHPLTTDLPNNTRTQLRTNHTTDHIAPLLESTTPFTLNDLTITIAQLS